MKLSTRVLIYLGIIAATLIAYEPIRHNGFVIYDDTAYITQCPDIQKPLTLQSLGEAFTHPHFFMWHPLTTIITMLDYQLYKLAPLGHHLTSVLFHIISALLLFKILSATTKTIWSSAFVAAAFALHPLAVESIAWASELKTATSGLFCMLTIAAYIRYTSQPRMGRYILLLLTFGVCIMTKPTVVTLPFALLLLDYWPLGRTNWKKQIVEKIPLFAMSAFLSIITFIVQHSGGVVKSLEKMPIDYRIANMFASYIKYIGKTIWPSKLAVFYPTAPQSAAPFYAALFIIITIICIYIGRHKKYLITGWLWYAGILIPTIGLIQAGAQAMANRYMYLPIIGLLIIGVWTVKDFIAARPGWKKASAALAVILLSSAAMLTRMQLKHWQNGATLFEYTLNATENNPMAENNYAYALLEAGNISKAEQILNSLKQRYPSFPETYGNLGQLFIKQGKPDKAVACFNELIRQKQDSVELYYYLATALSMQNKHNDAVKYLDKALKLEPDYIPAHKQMGNALLAAGKAEESLPYLNKVLKAEPDNINAITNLGTAYMSLGRYKPAIHQLTKAVELQPDNYNILNNLAWILATANDASARDANKAVAYAHRVCELTNFNNAGYLDTLAAAYAADGKFKDAQAAAEKAVNLAQAGGLKDLISEIQSRIELYKAGRGYIEK